MLSETFLAGRRVHLENKLAKVLNEADALQTRIRDRIARPEEEVLYDLKQQIARRIRAAQERLNFGTYGTCTACHRPIPRSRLERMPDAPTCVPCSDRSMS